MSGFCPSPVSFDRMRKRLCYGLAFLFLVSLVSVGCVVEPKTEVPTGCETCPERCLKGSDGTGQCVACLTNEQCQDASHPTRICTPDNRCVCGGSQDCGTGESCQDGICVSSCPAAAPCQKGVKRCDASSAGQNQYQECVQNAKGCWEWGAIKACPASLKCVRNGECQGESCPAEQLLCGGACVDYKTSTRHCGSCNNACKSGQVCVDGACSITCKDSSKTACGDTCVDIKQNDYHCGACDAKCPAKQTCSNGSCVPCTANNIREVCGNNKDDDCDGSIDEAIDCKEIKVGHNISDFAVSSKENLFVVSYSSKGVEASCWKADGTALRSLFTISPKGEFQLAFPAVYTAPGASMYVVSWLEWASKESTSVNLYLQRFDANCQPLGAKMEWPTPPGDGSTQYSVAMDGNGTFGVAYRGAEKELKILFFDKDGKKLGELEVEKSDKPKCPRGSYGMHLSMNASGAGVISCQKHQSDAVHYRRFSDTRAFLDTELVAVKGSVKNSSWTRSHTVGINDQGAFVIQWQSRAQGENLATFYAKDGSEKVSDLAVSPYVGRGYDGFRQVHQQIQTLDGDFVLRDTVTSDKDMPTWYRYSSDGTLVSALRGVYKPELLRTNGKVAYVVAGLTIQKKSFVKGLGLCKGTACLCAPGTNRVCYRGGTTTTNVRGNCKTGTQVCDADGLGWGACTGEVLPSPEICGNTIDDDCDGQTDEDCGDPNALSTPGTNDISVSSKGDVVGIDWTGVALVGYCFSPDGKVKAGSFIVTAASKQVTNPFVKMSRNGKFFVVMWRGTPLYSDSSYNTFVRIYGEDCKPVSDAIQLTVKRGGEWYDAAIANDGRISLVYYNEANELYWVQYDSKGTVLTQAAKLEDGKKCRHATRIGVSATTGVGVMTCQNHASDPIYYRRFDGQGVFLDKEWVEVASTKSNSSWYASHILGVNANGEFAIEWQSSKDKTFYANFYDAKGLLVKSVTVGTAMQSTFDSFRFAHTGMPLFGDDFVLQDGGKRGKPVTWHRYSPKGESKSKAAMGVDTYKRESLRVGNGKTYIIDGTTIRIGKIAFQ